MSATTTSTARTPKSPTRIESWAVAAVGIVDRYGAPLLVRTYTSPEHVLTSADAPLQAHLLVTPEDVVKLHFLLFSSVDRCNELVETQREVLRNTSRATVAAALASASAGASASRTTLPAAPSVLPRQLNAYQLPLDNPTFAPGRQGSTRTYTSAATSAAAPSAASGGGGGNNSNTSDPRFVGKLIHGYRFTSYGMVSASGIRTILITVGASAAPLDAVVPLCRTIYESASIALCNPLRTPTMCWRMQGELMEMRRQAYLEAVAQLPMSLPPSRTTLKSTSAQMTPQEQGGAAMPSDGHADSDGQALASSPSEAVAEAEAIWLQAAALRPSSLDRAHRLRLPAGTSEMGWCRAAPSSAAVRGSGEYEHQEPPLAYSELLRDQLESLLPPFTATARSCIIH